MKIRSLMIATAALSAMAGAATAQVTDNASVPVTASFVAPISITAGNSLDFGTATTPTAASDITISAAGSRSTTGAGGLALLASDPGSAATFDVDGEGGLGVTLALSHTVGTSGYTLSAFTASGAGDCSGVTTTAITLTGTGAAECIVSVGATLAVPSGASGTISAGTLNATVTYN